MAAILSLPQCVNWVVIGFNNHNGLLSFWCEAINLHQVWLRAAHRILFNGISIKTNILSCKKFKFSFSLKKSYTCYEWESCWLIVSCILRSKLCEIWVKMFLHFFEKKKKICKCLLQNDSHFVQAFVYRWYRTGGQNLSSVKTPGGHAAICLVNTMATDDLVMQGARASIVMAMI